MMSHYTKLWGSIVHSTVWRESPETKVVWITLLALADTSGYVGASLPGLADAARVSLDDCLAALDRLKAPDPHSRTKDHDGRRLEEVDGGWLILNYAKHREGTAAEARRQQNREAQKRHRDRKREEREQAAARKPERKRVSDDVSAHKRVSPKSAQAEAEAEAEADVELQELPAAVAPCSSTPPRGGDGAAAPPEAPMFADPDAQAALEATLRASPNPPAVRASISAVISGLTPPGYPEAIVGRALLELQASGSRFSPAILRAFCRRLLTPADAGLPTRPGDRIAAGRAALADWVAEASAE